MRHAALTPTFLAIAALAVLAGCEANAGKHEMTTHHRDIVDTASSAGSFNTLLAAAKAADLVDTLKSPGPFTVFAPTDAAFEKLPHGAVDALLADKHKLRSVLLYHVVSGRVTAADVAKLHEARTVQGAPVKISTCSGKVNVGPATVVQADVGASNGVIHVIDTVLMPPGT